MKGSKYIGKRMQNQVGKWYTIIDVKSNKMWVKFDDSDIIKETDYSQCRKGKVAHPNDEKEKHGDTGTRLYKEWDNIWWRCNPKSKDHKTYYSDKGIKVCDEWKSYTKFKEWALNNGYKDGLSLDRIDSNGNYCPENCQWITIEENIARAHNKKVIRINKKTKDITEFESSTLASKRLGYSYNYISALIRGDIKTKDEEYDWYYAEDYYSENK